MAKKIYAQARVVKGQRWYIDYTAFDRETGKEARHRQDFDLNDIPNLEVRELVADRLVNHLSVFVRPAQKTSPSLISSVSVAEGVELACSIKYRLPRINSHKQYKSISKIFLKWCKGRDYAALPLPDFTQKHARAFWHFLNEKKYAGRTLNNYLTALKGLWSELIGEEQIAVNSWDKIKPARVGEKRRRPFTDDERRVVASWAKGNDYWMFRGILLQYFCYIRPVEISRLKFRDFDFAKGTIIIHEGNAKSWKKRVATLPKSILHYFIDGRFEKYPANFFVLGRIPARVGRWEIHPSTTALNECRMNKRHSRTLERLKEAGQLGDIEGLSWYSWKDTGISRHVRTTSPVATKDQAGHSSFNMTAIYYHADEINEEYQKMENDLVE